MLDTLITDRLGYARYAAQGGDWGSFVTAWLGANRAPHLAGIHLNMLPLRRDAVAFAHPSPAEQQYLQALQHFLKEEAGYQAIQGTRPQTLAFALADSPVGLAAWFSEKYRAWTDNRGDPREALSMDQMLGNLSLYWFTGCIGASFWPYYARLHGPWPIEGRIAVPTGYAAFPREILLLVVQLQNKGAVHGVSMQPIRETPVLEDVTLTLIRQSPQFLYAEEGVEE